jgi:hypothetical protein
MLFQRIQDLDEATQGSPISIQGSTQQQLVGPIVGENVSNEPHSNKRKLETCQYDVSSFRRVRLLQQQKRQKRFLAKEQFVKFQALIYKLYVEQNKSLPEVERIMEEEHGFVASYIPFNLEFWAEKY